MKSRVFYLFLIFIYVFFLAFFYYVYVPLIPAYQFALGPLLFIIFVLTAIKIEWGLHFFIFLFPLINILPYFFHIFEHIPHAPAALILFLFFFIGWLLHRMLFVSDRKPIFHPLSPVMTLYAILILISGLITFFRYGNFSPLLSNGFPELIVNADGVRAGGARMSVVFGCLNMISGIMFSFILFPYLRKRSFRSTAFTVLLLSFMLSLAYGLFQILTGSNLARTPLWIKLKQYQSTYKDPNAFAFFLSAFLPLVLAFFIVFPKRRFLKVIFFVLSFICLSASGTRSAILASFVGVIVVLFSFVRQINIPSRRKTALSILLILATSILFFALASSLPFSAKRRLDKSWPHLKAGALDKLSSGKITLWKVAVTMLRDFPISGVGTGAYIVELPNYLIESGLGQVPSDSAENVIFQVGAELGLAGFILLLLLSIKFLQEAKCSWRLLVNREDKVLLGGFAGSLIACCVNFMFHSYIGSFEVKYLFWFLVTWLLAWKPETLVNDRSYSNPSTSKQSLFSLERPLAFKSIGAVILILFFASHLSNSLTKLSIPERTKQFGWKQDFGFYGWEKDWRGFSFRWAKKEAGLEVEKRGLKAILPILATHPDIEKNPVKVRIYLANKWFKKKRQYYSLEIKNKDWQYIEIPLAGSNESRESEISSQEILSKQKSVGQSQAEGINLLIETSRDWKPGQVLKIPDPRNIACGLGQIWYSYPPLESEDRIVILKTIPESQWEGLQKSQLASNGSAEITFSISEEKSYLRLRVRGQKAVGLGPYFEVFLNNELQAITLLEKEEWTYLYLPEPIKPGVHRLRVEFLNDFYAPSLGQNRNLFLGSVEVIRWQPGG